MYYKEGEFQALGLMKESDGYQEVLGYWFIPVMLITIIILYFIITLILKAKRILNNKK
jgi:hypothetical protein